MKMIVNGEEIVLDGTTSIAAFLTQRELSPDSVVVELNREIIETPHYNTTMLKEKDILEILRFVGGG